MTLILVRHGETTWNAEQRYQGQQESDLSALGYAQAQWAADRLADSGAIALYSSDLRRAADFAAVIGDRLGLAVETTPALRERCGGVWEGLTWPEIVERFAEAAEAVGKDPDFTPPGAESREHMRERVVEFLDRVAAHHAADVVIAVTHGGVINAVLRYIMGGSLTPGGRTRVDNGAITVVSHDDDGWRVDTFNDICHVRQHEIEPEEAQPLRLWEHE
jgi:broad specificity phosphatase PhoE